MRTLIVFLAILWPLAGQQPDTRARRIELNLLGQTAADEGESRRNENVQFNPVDNNALKELNIRLGVNANLVTEFRADRSWWGAEFGQAAAPSFHLPARAWKPGFHGSTRWSHLNSVTSARAFFQAGPVQPARENDASADFTIRLWRGASLGANASWQAIRGMVNGNVLVPRPDERTPLATDPAIPTRRANSCRGRHSRICSPPTRAGISAAARSTRAASRTSTPRWNASGL